MNSSPSQQQDNNIWNCGMDDEFESFLFNDEEEQPSMSNSTGGLCSEIHHNTNYHHHQQISNFGGFNNDHYQQGNNNENGNNVGSVNNTPQVVMVMIERSEYSCLSCRQLHRKCDKTLPSCSHCLKRGCNCIYEKPRRRGAVQPNQTTFVIVDGRGNEVKQTNGQPTLEKSSTNSTSGKSRNGLISSTSSNRLASKTVNRKTEPYQNIVNNNVNRINNSEMQNELNYRFVSTKTLDIYFDVIACGAPLVERQKMEQVLEYQANLYNPSFSTSGCDFYSNQIEFEKDQALLFTLQALCLQQIGHRDVSLQVFHQGKQILGKYFDDTDSMSVLLALKFTAVYLLGEGERRKARVMMSTVKAGIEPYLKKNEKLKEITDLDLILKNTRSFTSLLIESQLKLIDLYMYEEICPDTYLFEAVQELSAGKMKFTEEERAKGCKNLDREIYDKLRSIMKALMCLIDIVVESESTESVALLMLGLLLTTKQVWLEILINAHDSFRDLNEILQVSSEIIGLTRSKHFPYLQINATKGIILAATLRANYYFKLSPSEDINDDLRALRSLSKKFKYIQTECIDLVKALETLTYMSSTSGNLNLFSVEEIFNFTNSNRTENEPSLKPNTEGGLIGFYNDYVENHRAVMNSVMEDSNLFDELVNCLVDQDKIKKEITDPIQKIESLHSRKLQLVKAFRDNAMNKKDIYHVIETELMQKQLVYDLEVEKGKLLNQF